MPIQAAPIRKTGEEFMAQMVQTATQDERAMAIQTEDLDTLDSGFLKRLVDGDRAAFWSLWGQYQHEFFIDTVYGSWKGIMKMQRMFCTAPA